MPQEATSSSNLQSRTGNWQPRQEEDKAWDGTNEGKVTSAAETIFNSIQSRRIAVNENLPTWPPTCIYRVPKALREVNEKAFTPFLVSIGPFHFGGENLLPMDDRKLLCLDSFLDESKGTLQSYIELVKRNELKIRQCYSNPTNIDSEKFIEMVLLDSVFIIQLLRGGISLESGIASKRIQIERDLLLAENQLPFFILCDLYRAAFCPDGDITVPSFTHIVCQFFQVFDYGVRIDNVTNEADCYHLLDMLRTYYPRMLRKYYPYYVKRRMKSEIVLARPLDTNSGFRILRIVAWTLVRWFVCLPIFLCINVWKLLWWFIGLLIGKEEEEDEKIMKIMSPSATSLHQAGVKFVANENYDLLAIQFDMEKGSLTIPKLMLDNRMEVLIMNLIAFEQCDFSSYAPFTHYLRFMDFLINTPEDVKLLVEASIIENLLGSEEDVCYIFNTVAKDTEFFPRGYEYAEISRQLNIHCKRRLNRNRAILTQNYFGHPWATISVIYAVVLLLLTIGQFVTGIISLRQNK